MKTIDSAFASILGSVMGLWFFLTVVVLSNMAFKAYKLRIVNQQIRSDNERLTMLMNEVKVLKEELAREKHGQRLAQLEDAVFFGDFELKQKFNVLEKEMEHGVLE